MRFAIPSPEEVVAPSGARDIRFVLRSVSVVGSTVLSQQSLSESYSNLLDREISLADVYAIANRITGSYAARGYALSFAVVPIQEIENGAVRIDVIEGYIAKVRLEDKRVPVPPALADYAVKLLRSRPLRNADLERYLLLANELPGYSVRGVLAALEDKHVAAGATQLILHVEHKLIEAEIGIDNLGPDALGPWRQSTEFSINSAFGYGEQIHFRLLTSLPTRELKYGAGSIGGVVGGEGLILNAWASYSRTEPELTLLGPGIFSGTSRLAGITATYPLFRSRAVSLSIEAAASAKSLDGSLLGVPNSRDRIYPVEFGLAYFARGRGISFARLRFTQGLPLFGATDASSPLRSRSSGSATYSAVNLYLSHDEPLWPGFDLLLTAEGQVASRPLLASEQCSFGGTPFGRGFEEGMVVGDDCAMASAELRYTPFSGGGDRLAGLSLVQLYGFCDSGIAWQRGILLPGETSVGAGRSAGGGIRVAFGFGLSASFEAAVPIHRVGAALSPSRDTLFLVQVKQGL